MPVLSATRLSVTRGSRRRAGLGDPFWDLVGSIPAVDFNFSSDSMLDQVSGADLITYTRPSTAWGWNGSQFVEFANDVPRIVVDPETGLRGLLVEEARTNGLRNSAANGAVVGTPGTTPTSWGVPTVVAGINREVIDVGTELGQPYIDLRFSGTASAASGFNIAPETTTGVAASNDQVWTASAGIRVVAGSIPAGAAINVLVSGRNAGGGLLNVGGTYGVSATAGAPGVRVSGTNTMPGASTAFAYPIIQLSFSNGSVIDVTLRIYSPQLELGAFPTSPIITTGSALTRSADVASVTGANFSSWYPGATLSPYVEGVAGPIGVDKFPRLLQIKNEPGNERIILQRFGEAGTSRYAVAAGGVTQAAGDSGAQAAGSLVRHAVAIAVDDFAFQANGGNLVTDNSGTVPVVDSMTIGFDGGNESCNSIISRVTIWPTRLPNATLQALTAE